MAAAEVSGWSVRRADEDTATLFETRDEAARAAIDAAEAHGWSVIVYAPSTGVGSRPRKPAKSRSGLARIKVAAEAPSAYDVRPKVANAIRALGNNTVAELLGVSRSQPGRWVRGEERPSAENEAAVLDLDFVLSLLLLAMPPDLAGIWLVSSNAHLNGARPVDAFRLGAHRRVADAIQAYADGLYA